MGVYIKNLEIPDNCRQCFFFTERELMCKVTENFVLVENMIKKRPHNCPLVEVKTPHGRLIDADEMQEYISLGGLNPDNVSTVIESED